MHNNRFTLLTWATQPMTVQPLWETVLERPQMPTIAGRHNRTIHLNGSPLHLPGLNQYLVVGHSHAPPLPQDEKTYETRERCAAPQPAALSTRPHLHAQAALLNGQCRSRALRGGGRVGRCALCIRHGARCWGRRWRGPERRNK